MTKSEHSYEAVELLDFLAEGFLQQGRSISYIDIDGLSAFAVTSEDSESEIFFSIPADSLSSALAGLKSEDTLTVPVLTEEEQHSLLKTVQQLKLKNVKCYRLSFYQRYSFRMKQFQKRNYKAS